MRRRRGLLRLISAMAIVAASLFQAGVASAGTVRFGGEVEDNLWSVTTTYCRDGIIITATQTQLGDGLPFSLQLKGSNPAVRRSLPSPIVQGDGSLLVHGTATFVYSTPITPGTPAGVYIERWDHGAPSPDGDHDGSPTDDSATDTGVTGTCTVAPRTSLLHAQGIQGAPNALTGTGVAPNEAITAYWATPGGSVLGHTMTDAQGAFTGTTALAFTTPVSRLGSYAVIAVGQSSADIVSSTLAVRAALRITPSSGLPVLQGNVALLPSGPLQPCLVV